MLKNTAFIHNCTITLTKLITKFICSLEYYVPVILKFSISKLHFLIKLFITITTHIRTCLILLSQTGSCILGIKLANFRQEVLNPQVLVCGCLL